MIQAYATITVPLPGTPVHITASDQSQLTHVHGVLIQALPTNSGKIYIGSKALNKGASTGLYAFLAIPTANQIPSYSVALPLAAAAINLQDFYIDADNVGEGVIVSAIIT